MKEYFKETEMSAVIVSSWGARAYVCYYGNVDDMEKINPGWVMDIAVEKISLNSWFPPHFKIIFI